MARNALEGFHEVNLSSPTTPEEAVDEAEGGGPRRAAQLTRRNAAGIAVYVPTIAHARRAPPRTSSGPGSGPGNATAAVANTYVVSSASPRPASLATTAAAVPGTWHTGAGLSPKPAYRALKSTPNGVARPASAPASTGAAQGLMRARVPGQRGAADGARGPARSPPLRRCAGGSDRASGSPSPHRSSPHRSSPHRSSPDSADSDDCKPVRPCNPVRVDDGDDDDDDEDDGDDEGGDDDERGGGGGNRPVAGARVAPAHPGRAGGNEDAGESFTSGISRLRSPSVKEVKEKGYERLKEELAKAQEDLKLKDEECERLSKVRDQLGQELEELTASLFEEAHKMVREANVKQATAEKQLNEAQGKIDVLQAEVTALKTLVITSTPSSPNKELHPQLQPSGKAAPFKKGHIRNKSTSSAILAPNSFAEAPDVLYAFARECREVDMLAFAEFKAWKDAPTLEHTCPFLERIYREDITPCLCFPKGELGQAIQMAVENNTLSMEPVGVQSLPVVKASAIECGGPNGRRAQIVTKCALSGQSRSCRHRVKLGEASSHYYYVSPSCRARITAVCNFFTYIRYIQQGLVKQDAEQMFWEVMKLRREMSVAKLGFFKDEL
ncbi:guanine nucleotide exchange factor for Rab-3A-like isoform X3 [Lethenteron reissneri]|uniref:guanine nucleotide exchange factor for Rab-3A-like isoform X3 n=1 Tax=Lethenteron reissneri TaxID=7753 RepID=UPI002AB62B16|nr:guanine nucleotide exchange factor for Rab-3A-like isoform X3 [Lethenteron reissneri]